MTSIRMLTEVTINSIDISAKILKWNVVRTDGSEVSSCIIEVPKSVDSLVTLTVGQTVTVKRGPVTATDHYVFKGEIIKIEETGFSYRITCYDQLYDAIKKEITYSFDRDIDSEAGQISALFSTLVNTYTDLTTTASEVVATGTLNTQTLKKFVCRHEDVYDKMQELAKLVNYQFYYKPSNDRVYFEPQGYTAASIALTVGGNVINIPKWVNDKSDMVNKANVIGATQNVQSTETGQLDVTSGWTSGDAGTSAALAAKPISVKVYADAASPPTTLRTGGVVGATASYDYYVDLDNKKTIWETAGGYAWTANHHVLIDYTYAIPAPVTISDAASIATYKKHEKTFNPKQVMVVDDAEQYARAIIAEFKDPMKTTVLNVYGVYDLDASQTATVVDANNGVNSSFYIKKIEFNYPYSSDKVVVGDRAITLENFNVSMIKKIQELEQSLLGDSDFLVSIFDLSRTIKPRRRSFEIQKKTYDDPETDVFILGSYKYGVLGTNKLGDTSGASASTALLLQGQNTYEEYIYDDDYDDSSSATWDTTNEEIDFTSGQVATTKTVCYGPTITEIYLTVQYTGTLTLQVTADGGSNWETVTATSGERVKHIFTNSGTDLRFKATEAAATTAQIGTTFDAYGQFDKPGIKIEVTGKT